MSGKLITRLRGILGTGVSWGVAWSAASAALHTVAVLFGEPGVGGGDLLPGVLTSGLMGFCGGAVFAGGFLLSEGQKQLVEIRIVSGALWGLVAGFAAPGGIATALGEFPEYLTFMLGNPAWLVTFLVLGAGSGSAMTAMAKAAEARELESGGKSRRFWCPPLES